MSLTPDAREGSPTWKTTNLVIVDRALLYRESLAATLRARSWTGHVHIAADAAVAVRCLQHFRPDVVLVNFRDADSLAVVAALHAIAPQLPVVVLAVSEVEDEIVTCAEAGVSGFLPCPGGLADLEATVAAVVRGETHCSPRVAGALLRRVTALAALRAGPGDASALTPREREVLMLIERGMTNKEIANELGIEVRTVKNHVHNLFEKLRVHRRGEAAACLRDARVPSLAVLRRTGRGSTRLGLGSVPEPSTAIRTGKD